MVEMSSPAIAEAAKAGAPVLIPVGVIEEHGPHLGLGSDIYLSIYLARRDTTLVDRYYGDPARLATDGIRRAANVAAANIADQVANAERHS